MPLAAGRESFMGVMKPLPEQLDIASVFMTPAGIIASVSRGFSNLFGHSPSDIIGGSVSHSSGPAPHSWHYLPALCCFCMLCTLPVLCLHGHAQAALPCRSRPS